MDLADPGSTTLYWELQRQFQEADSISASRGDVQIDGWAVVGFFAAFVFARMRLASSRRRGDV